MTALSPTTTGSIGRPVLADRVFAHSRVTDAILVVGGAALTAALAQVTIHSAFGVPLWPVAITGQTLAVLLVGASLGAVRATLSMVLYALLGVVGLPVFSDGDSGLSQILGPSGGYIIGFVFAAAFTGWLASRKWDRRILAGMASFVAGSIVVFAFGLPWLAISLGYDLQQTLEGGLYPFIVGGFIKAAIAAAVLRTAWFVVDRNQR